MSESCRFRLPEGVDVESLLERVTPRGSVVWDRSRSVRRTILDTFDWRVAAEGWVFERERAGGRSLLVLRSCEGAEIARLEGAEAPGFEWDMPEGSLRDRLGSVLEMRALGPVAELSTDRVTARIVDGEAKTRVRVLVERSTLAGRGRHRGTELGSVLTVLPLRGYEGDAVRLTEALVALGGPPAGGATSSGLEGGAPDPVDAAFAVLGHRPGWYSSKLRVALTSELPAAEAYRLLFLRLRETMRDNADGLVADRDSEFLHDYRVAVRRTRSLLGQAKGVLPAEVVAAGKDDWRWLGGVTSPTRDLDVWLLTLPELEAAVPSLLEGGLGRLDAHVVDLQRAAHRELVDELDGERCTAFLAAWDRWLAGDPHLDPVAVPDAARPVVEVARERIWRAYRRVLHHGRRIEADTPGEVLHELRKDAKKLRYLLECFSSLFPPDDIKAVVRELKVVQDVLGAFQDCEVQTASLTGFGVGVLASGGRAPKSDLAVTLMAMGSLVELIEERRVDAREAFAGRFARFDRRDNRDRYRRLFGPVREGDG